MGPGTPKQAPGSTKEAPPEAQAETLTVSIADIVRERRHQVRRLIDPGTVGRYARVIAAGEIMPPITLARMNGALILVDGWHRLAAHDEAGKAVVVATIITATPREALWLAAQANLRHGLPLKTSEMRAVFRAFIHARRHRKTGQQHPMSYRSIAAALNGVVTHGTVRNWMMRDFPMIAAEYSEEDPRGKGGGNKIEAPPGPEGIIADALRTATAAVPGITDPWDRKRLLHDARALAAWIEASGPLSESPIF